MKIGMVCYPTIGGSGVVATTLGKELAARGHEVHFITYEVPFRLDIDGEGIHFHQVDIVDYDLFRYPDYALTLAVKIARVAQEWNLDVLHVHYAVPHAASAYLAKQLLAEDKPAIVVTLHGTDITLVGRDPAYAKLVKFSMEQADGVTAVSHDLREQTLQAFGIERKIEVIHNFFTPQQEESQRHRFVSEEQKLLIHASNFRKVKRVCDVVSVFRQVRQHLDCKLLLVGTGNNIEDVKSQVVDDGLENDVIFLGRCRDIDAYLTSGDLFLLPSNQESFGLVALEAMAYGVPVIASDVGGIREVVAHGETGFLAPVGDIETMTKYALVLLSNDELYQSTSDRAKQRATGMFAASKIVPQYETFYEKCLGAVEISKRN